MGNLAVLGGENWEWGRRRSFFREGAGGVCGGEWAGRGEGNDENAT